jgi:hypothetical protein
VIDVNYILNTYCIFNDNCLNSLQVTYLYNLIDNCKEIIKLTNEKKEELNRSGDKVMMPLVDKLRELNLI